MGGHEGCTHLEVASIVLAFVAVTTLFAVVSLGAGAAAGSHPSSALSAYPVLVAGEPRLAPVGEITGSSSVPGFVGTTIDTLSFRITHTGEDGSVDLSRATVTVMAGEYLEILARSGDHRPGSGTWTATPLRGGTHLEAGEECTVLLSLDRPIPADAILTIKVRPEGSTPCSISGPVRVLQGDAGNPS
jgi:hypothetical protein